MPPRPPAPPEVFAGPQPPLADQIRMGRVFSVDCPSRAFLAHMTSRWGVLVLVALLSGRRRFAELRRAIGGISERMLAQTLRQFEADGLVERRDHNEVPPRVDYALTPLGREAAEHVRALADWVEINLPRLMAAEAEPEAEPEPRPTPAPAD